MEIDDLKRSWNQLDEQLQKEKIVDEDKLAELISNYESNANTKLGYLTRWQKVSVIAGTAGLFFLAFITTLLPTLVENEVARSKIMVMVAILAVTLVFASLWDLKTYIFSKNTNIYEMPLLTVIERMNKFKRWIKNELYIISAWIIMFTIFVFWVMGYYNEPWHIQAIFITFFIAFDVTVIYIFYKKIFYDNWKELQKNLDELKELKS